MKYLVGLIGMVMTQSFSAKAINTLNVPQNNRTVIHEHVVYSKVNQSIYDTIVSVPLAHINTLTVKSTPNGILINWMVEDATNLQYFLIEESTDGQCFSPLYELPVVLFKKTYSFVDIKSRKSDSKVYYRVKAVYPTTIIESPIRKP